MPQPNKIPLAFAASGDKNIIPESTETIGLASWREGFPAITSAPFSEGGIAPKRADFNGIFNALSQAVIWMQQGGVYAYDADTDYEAGNVVLDAGGLYVANAANGPSSAVVQPSSDTTGATWKLVRLNLATQSVAGYMSATDKAALDNVPSTYLPLTGGELTGPISVNGKALVTVETGTWTPILYGGSTAGSIAITTNNCFYQKFGNLVYVRVRFEYRITSSPTGEVRIGGAPYVPDFYYTDWMVANANTGLALSVTNTGIIRPAYLNTSTGRLVVTDWGATASSSVWANGVDKTDMVLGQLWYRASA